MTLRVFSNVLLPLILLVVVSQSWAVPCLPENETSGAEIAGPIDKAELFHTVVNNPGLIFERFKRACAQDFQNPDHIRVQIARTPTPRLLGGFFTGVDVYGRGGGVDKLKLQNFRLRCKGVHFDLQALVADGVLKIRRIESMDIAFSVSEEALNACFRSHSGRLRVKNPEIEMHDGEIVFRGGIRTFLFKSRIEARGPLVLNADGQANFDLRRLRVSRFTLPRFITRQIARKVNPIADFTRLKFWNCWNLHLESLILREGSMTVSSFPRESVDDFIRCAWAAEK